MIIFIVTMLGNASTRQYILNCIVYELIVASLSRITTIGCFVVITISSICVIFAHVIIALFIVIDTAKCHDTAIYRRRNGWTDCVIALKRERRVEAGCCAVCVTEELDEEVGAARLDVERLKLTAEETCKCEQF